MVLCVVDLCCFFFQAEDGIRDLVRSRGLGDVYKRQGVHPADAEALRHGRSDLGITHGIGHLFPLGLGIAKVFVPLPPVNPEVQLEDGASLMDYGLAAQVFHTPGPVSYTHLTLPTIYSV